MTIAEESRDVAAGDLILIPSHSAHRLDNLVETPLRFVSFYWTHALISPMAERTLVIPAPPTPNGPLHVGHLSGPYLAADVYTRYAHLCGSQAQFVMSTDDNQCYVPAKGRQLAISSEEVVGRFTPLIATALSRFGCTVHQRLQPLGKADYTRYVQERFESLVKAGKVELRKELAAQCIETGQFIYGAQISGNCPHCGQGTSGNGCEACGHYNHASDLKNPISQLGSQGVQLVETERYVFPLSQYADSLKRSLSQIAMHPRLRAFYESYLAEGLPDVAVSQHGSWGIPCPERPGQVLYEWFEMAACYLYLAGGASEGQTSHWVNPRDAVVQTFGIDNSFFYGFLVPALIEQMQPNAQLPKAFLFNFFYRLEGKKFSTSRGHAIWGHEILESVPADPLRFFLALTRAEDAESDFSLSAFGSFVDSELVDRWESQIESLAKFSDPSFSKKAPLSGEEERFLWNVDQQVEKIHEAYSAERFSLNSVARGLLTVQDHIRRHSQCYALTASSASPNAEFVVLSALRLWAQLLRPLMPGYASRLSDAFGPTQSLFAVSLSESVSFKAADLPLTSMRHAQESLRKYRGV